MTLIAFAALTIRGLYPSACDFTIALTAMLVAAPGHQGLADGLDAALVASADGSGCTPERREIDDETK